VKRSIDWIGVGIGGWCGVVDLGVVVEWVGEGGEERISLVYTLRLW